MKQEKKVILLAGQTASAKSQLALRLAKNLNELVKTFWEYDKGYIKMPQKPGLGVEIDEKNILKNSVNI